MAFSLLIRTGDLRLGRIRVQSLASSPQPPDPLTVRRRRSSARRRVSSETARFAQSLPRERRSGSRRAPPRDGSPHGRRVAVVDAAAQRDTSSAFRSSVPTNTSGRASSACRSPATPSKAPPPGMLPGRVDRRPAFAECPPAADGVEILERKAERIDAAMARRAHRVAAMFGHQLAHRLRAAARSVLLERRHVRPAAEAAACRGCFRGSICRGAPARCAWHAR